MSQRRGLVLIDPPFEAQDGEFRFIEKALADAAKRWPSGIYAVWYPIVYWAFLALTTVAALPHLFRKPAKQAVRWTTARVGRAS